MTWAGPEFRSKRSASGVINYYQRGHGAIKSDAFKDIHHCFCNTDCFGVSELTSYFSKFVINRFSDHSLIELSKTDQSILESLLISPYQTRVETIFLDCHPFTQTMGVNK